MITNLGTWRITLCWSPWPLNKSSENDENDTKIDRQNAKEVWRENMEIVLT